jgi:hypothetical protein
MINGIVLLHRLSTFEDPAWDCRIVRETIDILDVLDRLIGSFKMLQVESGEGSAGELFGKMAMVFEWVRNTSRSKLTGAEEAEGSCGTEGVQIVVEEIGEMGMQDMMGGVDDSWLNEMLGSWNYDFMSR